MNCFEVVIVDDITLERQTEDFILRITDAEDNVHVHSENLTVNIIDDDSK